MFIYRQKPDASDEKPTDKAASSHQAPGGSYDNGDIDRKAHSPARFRKRKLIEETPPASVNLEGSKRRHHAKNKSLKGIPTPGRSKRSSRRICPVCCETDISNDSVETHVSCKANCGVDICRSCFVRWIDVVITNGEHAEKIQADGSIRCVSCESSYGPDVLHRVLPSKQSRQIVELCRARHTPHLSKSSFARASSSSAASPSSEPKSTDVGLHQCSGCSQYYVKSAGCNKGHCVRCRINFCFVCSKEWKAAECGEYCERGIDNNGVPHFCTHFKCLDCHRLPDRMHTSRLSLNPLRSACGGCPLWTEMEETIQEHFKELSELAPPRRNSSTSSSSTDSFFGRFSGCSRRNKSTSS